MEERINIAEILSASWNALKSQIWILVGLLVGMIILISVFSMLLMPSMKTITGILIADVIMLVIGLVFRLGYVKNLFQALDGEEPQFSAYGQQARKIGTYFVAEVLFSLVVIVGLALLVIPGIYLMLRLMFFETLIVDEDAGILESLRRSWQLTEGQVMPLFLLFLVILGLTLLGLLLLGVGIFITWPLAMMMVCYAFRRLKRTDHSQSLSGSM